MNLSFGMLGLLLIINIVSERANSIRWIGLGKLSRAHELEMEGFTRFECDSAKKTRLLKRRHYKFCLHSQNRFAMHAVLMASKAAAYYCMKTFKDRRWDCKSVEELPKVSPELELGTQEQAIVHAFSSAALLFEISRRCSQTKLHNCPCGLDTSNNRAATDSKMPRYYSENCPDNVEMGLQYTKRFLGYDRMGKPGKKVPIESTNDQKNGKSRKRLKKRINGHNYEVGLEIMKRSWKSKCKCHGVSGSCANEVCFKQLRRLDDDILLKELKDHYLAAKYVSYAKNGHLYTDQNLPLLKTELAFMEHSSDYCSPDTKVGSKGTQGRQCETLNLTLAETNHCDNMCCGRGFRRSIEQITERCKCSLDQNFVVKCKLCSRIVQNKFCV